MLYGLVIPDVASTLADRLPDTHPGNACPLCHQEFPMRILPALLLVLAAAGQQASAAPPRTADCHVGIYRLADGTAVDIGPTTDGLRWRLFDGRTGALRGEGPDFGSTLGATARPDGHRVSFDACDSGRIAFDGQPGERMPLVSVDTSFRSGDAVLSGRLVLPPGDGPVPVVVLVHGSEASSAVRHAPWQRMLPAAGIGAFVYDKRGTGRSTGHYTQDFHVLAADAAAAAREARRLAGSRMQSLVYEGGSQGGWVVPLAHRLEPADRLVIAYGLTVSPLEENRSEVLQDLAAAGFAGPDLDAAAEVVDATGTLMASGFREGLGEYARVRRKYRTAPWFARIDGEFSGRVLAYPPLALRLLAPLARRVSDRGTPWRHDPLPALRQADVPMLWVLAGADTSAPPAQTRDDLVMLQREGEPVTLLEFPGTEHGIYEFETRPDGSRVNTRVAAGYFSAVVDFAAEGRLQSGPYGNAVRTDPLLPNGDGGD